MKTYFIGLVIVILGIAIGWNVWKFNHALQPAIQPVSNTNTTDIIPQNKETNTIPETPSGKGEQKNDVAAKQTSAEDNKLNSPIDRASERVTKKPFGIFVTPKDSPVQPERFSGFHNAVDFETFPEEANVDVPIHAVCDGNVLAKRTASGYGGVFVQSCDLRGQPVTVVYGHLLLSSIKVNIGDTLQSGDPIGVLGTGYSKETDGERKHLHLGIHKGSTINIQGYVSSRVHLAGWLNACDYGGCN